jgi:anaerobic dimethyl sulfoxide reductase subunit B (iron-sulfur subunit)
MHRQIAFHLNISTCIGCKTCQIACADKNDLAVGVLWRRIVEYEGGTWVAHPTRADLTIPQDVFSYSISLSCLHCQDPACQDVCLTDAIWKRADGVVLINPANCTGCRDCERACPYDALAFDESTGRMTKCDLCQDLLTLGQNPVCVDACLMRAIEIGDLEELRARYGNVDAVKPVPEGHLTNPSLVLSLHRHSQPSKDGM